MVLKSGLRCRSSQITSMLRWVSASRRRLDRTRLRYGFARVSAKATGRPGYDPADLLKLYIYGLPPHRKTD